MALSGETHVSPMTPIERAISILIQTGDSVKPFWEGIILKKSSKKFAAILTLAAFVLTLVPMAAFAGEPASAQASLFVTSDSNEDNDNVNLDTATNTTKEIETKFIVKDAARDITTEKLTGGTAHPGVYVWAEDENGTVTDAAKQAPVAPLAAAASTIANTTKYDSVENDQKINFTFVRPGTYKIYAAVDLTADGAKTVADLTKIGMDANYQTIVVKADSQTAKYMDTTTSATLMAGTATTTALRATAEKTAKAAAIASNGIATGEQAVYVFDENGKIIENKEVTLKASSANVTLDKASLTTDRQGKINVKYTIKKAGTYKIYVKADSYEGILSVVGEEKSIDRINTTQEPKAPIAKDTDWNNAADMGDFIKFEVLDKDGVALNDITGEKIAAGDKDYIKVVEQPSGMKLDGKDFKVENVKAGSTDFTLTTTKKLKEGKYTVRVALLNGDTAQVSFEVKAFGTAKELKVEFDSESIALGAENVVPSAVKVVDKNGVERNVDESDAVQFGYNGYAVAAFASDAAKMVQAPFDTTPKDYFVFNVKNDEKYVGQKINFTAVSDKLGLAATTSLVVGDGNEGKNITFDKTNGAIDVDNKVVGQLVDKDNKSVSLASLGATSADVVAYVVKSNNPEAKVSVEVTDKEDLISKGQFELNLTANKANTAEVAVYVKDNNGKIYAQNLSYTFGKKAANADTNVVMTINSKDSIVNNKIVAIDAAPYIKMNRTFVPIRALAEDFGAKVDWNEKDQKVTVELDGNKVEMTIGSKDFTINGEKKTMDVAPEIVKDRTFVPVRFVAESLGFTVTPIYNTDGTTANVVFAK